MKKIKRNEYVNGGNVPVRYRVEDITLMRRQYHPGQKLILKFPRFIGYGKRYINEYKEYTVVATYPAYVSVLDSYSHRTSFQYVDLEHRVVKR